MIATETRFSVLTRSGAQPATSEPGAPWLPPGGVTPPGGNQGAPGSVVRGWSPELVRVENRVSLALLVKV